MADFSDTDTDDSAVEELLAEAMDASVLQQVAAINLSGFSDSLLPSQLESRFRRLKSLPSSSSSAQPLKPQFSTKSDSNAHEKSSSGCAFSLSNCSNSSNSTPQKAISPKLKENRSGCNDLEAKLGSGGAFSLSSCSSSSNSSPQKEVSPKLKVNRSGSPPGKFGCFWCSPKKGSKKKIDCGKEGEILGDLGEVFSSKEQKKLMKKVMKEEEKISREAEKIVKWAKQASARIDVSGIEDELSDDDSRHDFGIH